MSVSTVFVSAFNALLPDVKPIIVGPVALCMHGQLKILSSNESYYLPQMKKLSMFWHIYMEIS